MASSGVRLLLLPETAACYCLQRRMMTSSLNPSALEAFLPGDCLLAAAIGGGAGRGSNWWWLGLPLGTLH